MPADKAPARGPSVIESEPPFAGPIFGDRIDLARSYVSILVRDSDRLGLLGPREFSKIWSRHVAHCAILASELDQVAPPNPSGLGFSNSTSGGDCLDIGSGAGLPGIPLAIALPARHFTLLEPMERRAAWLRATVNELGLSNVDVLRERAEEHRKKYRIVTARAVAPLRNLITLAEPLLSQDSQSAGLFIKGQNAAAEIAEAGKVIQRMNRGHPQLLILGRELGADSLTVVRIQGSE